MGIPRQINHPQMGTSNLVGSPINMSDTPPRFVRPAPLLGEQTEKILERLGYGKEAIKELRDNKVI
jgi:crotonobetainyl-CoA:carnitine CoA-transferase CaiB-like acyl-CoA transferase